jgi:hypothetical protein
LTATFLWTRDARLNAKDAKNRKLLKLFLALLARLAVQSVFAFRLEFEQTKTAQQSEPDPVPHAHNISCFFSRRPLDHG